MRLFIGLAIPSDWRKVLSESIAPLKTTWSQSRAQASWVKPEFYHITLCFLGSVHPDQDRNVQMVLTEVTATQDSFTVPLESYGFFPPRGSPKIFWFGSERDIHPLSRLAFAIVSKLEPLGFRPDPRGFHPHITLARFKDNGPSQIMRNNLTKLSPPLLSSWTVHELVLFESRLSAAGPNYLVRRVFPFKQSRPSANF